MEHDILTFLDRAARAIARVREIEDELHTIIANADGLKAVDTTRDKVCTSRKLDLCDLLISVQTDVERNEKALDRAKRAAKIYRAAVAEIASYLMDPWERAIVITRWTGGVSWDEIAMGSGQSLSTVYRKRRAALKVLNEHHEVVDPIIEKAAADVEALYPVVVD
nr:MAG TPA: ECF sigma factor [Bacteriophage sp.]